MTRHNYGTGHQTIVHVVGIRTGSIGGQVRALLPGLVAEVRTKQNVVAGNRMCPLCGRPKSYNAIRCLACSKGRKYGGEPLADEHEGKVARNRLTSRTSRA